jgi:hypothetical protein
LFLTFRLGFFKFRGPNCRRLYLSATTILANNQFQNKGRVFVNRILALLRHMGDMTRMAIDEGTKQDLRWFISCAHAVNGTVQIYKCMQPRINIFVDASLKGVGGALQNYVYKLAA